MAQAPSLNGGVNEASVAAERYAHALSPLTIGRTIVRNRIFSSAHGTGFGVNGLLTERHVAYHRARAEGGIGLIIIEATAIDASPLSVAGDRGSSLRNADDGVIAGYRRLADMVHQAGAKLFCMLSHSGRNAVMGADGRSPVAPSPVPMDRTRDIPHELEREEISEIVRSFASAARRCREGGLDGVELSFTHGNLVQQFLSRSSNQRSDDYGGSEENRLRLAREVLTACRAAVGDDFTLGIRFAADELVADGYHIEDGCRYAPMMVEWGRLDFIDVSAGTNSDMASRSVHYPTISAEPGSLVHFAERIRGVVSVPVFCIGKISTLDQAEKIIAAGRADMVGMTRAHIAEPAIVNLTRQGRASEIRPCIYCNESCFGRSQRSLPITCIYNPRAGRELLWPDLPAIAAPRRVIVVGGGPAGMEAARMAAAIGHHVELHEATGRLGGQINELALAPHRAPYARIIDWMADRLADGGVGIHLGSRLSAQQIVDHRADAVIVATGAVEARPAVPGAGQAHVVSAREVLRGAPLNRDVLIVDLDGRFMGITVAEHVAARGHAVTLATPAFFVGMDAELLTWRPSYVRLLQAGVCMLPLQRLVSIGNDHATLRRLDDTTHEVAAQSVVFCTRGVSERSLYRALAGRVPMLRVIGDAWSPRQIEQAVFEGATAAREIS